MTALLVFSGFKNVPGIGIIGAVLAIAALLLFDDSVSLSTLGFSRPERWPTTIALGTLAGVLIQLLAVTIVEPATERFTGQKHDHSAVDSIKSSTSSLVQLLVVSWVLAAVFEELIFRGFLLRQSTQLLGHTNWSTAVAVVATSIAFGLSHWYQGRSGAASTAVVGLALGSIFVMSGFNLWMPVIAHGVIDTVGLILIAYGGDQALRDKLTPRALVI